MQLQRAQKIGKKFQCPIPTKVGGFTMLPKIIRASIGNKAETVPKIALGPFFTDPAAYAIAPRKRPEDHVVRAFVPC